jgi:two-component system, LytTR family, sensor kinase
MEGTRAAVRLPASHSASAAARAEAASLQGPVLTGRAVTPPLLLVATATLALGLLFGLIEAAQVHFRDAYTMRPSSWETALRIAMPPWLLYGLLAPGAFLLAERFRLDRRSRWSAALAHVLGAALFAVVHQYGLALFYVMGGDGVLSSAVLMKFQKLLILNFALDIMIYCAFVGSFHALLYYREFRARELAASQLQTGLTQARLEALRAQLNPHFLFNTLNAISVLALKGDRDGVVQMLSLLSELLRLSLDGHLPQAVPLADEIAFIDRYLELQRIRFSDRLEIQKSIEPDTLRALVPSLLLQPVVENAVLHGIAARRGPGRIDIVIKREGDELSLEVIDTGPGFKPGTVGNGDEGNGVGLRNTRARLHHMYGDAQSLTCNTLDTGGASVAIRIPFTAAAIAS